MNRIKKNLYICVAITIILMSISGYVYAIYKSFTMGNKAIAFTVYTEVEDIPIQIEDANVPRLVSGMIPVVWDETNLKWKAVANNATDWYDYSNNKWANVIMADGTYTSETLPEEYLFEENELGSMFVWIPRFEYKINYTTPGTVGDGGTIDVNFVSETRTTASAGYVIHPAFRNGNGIYSSGEWDDELAGFWVAKFEASNNNDSVKIVPNVNSWRNIAISDMFSIAQSTTYGITDSTSLNSHLMKNSEWGAVALLGYSIHGTNGQQVWVNNYFAGNKTITLTGVAGLTANDTSNANVASVKKYNTEGGGNASTTANITGVYDMSGGGNEYIAAYHTNCPEDLRLESSGISTKFVTVYNGTTWGNGSIEGDAMAETAGWNENARGVANATSGPTYMSATYPYLMRGGGPTDGPKGAGIFSFFIPASSTATASQYRGFRTVLCIN